MFHENECFWTAPILWRRCCGVALGTGLEAAPREFGTGMAFASLRGSRLIARYKGVVLGVFDLAARGIADQGLDLLTYETRRRPTMENFSRTSSIAMMAALLAVSFTLTLSAPAPAAAREKCVKAKLRLELEGKGDRDQDGLTKCEERKVTFTDPRDWDTDNDKLSDAAEARGLSDPLNPDSDGDGVDDGVEQINGTSPIDTDSDNDGLTDDVDPDPAGALSNKIEGAVDALNCPSQGGVGSVTVLGVVIGIDGNTRYDGAENCAALAQRRIDNGGAHVEVTVSSGQGGALSATRVDLEDADNDGSPDRIDTDDDNDGIEDDIDTDDDGDGVPDVDDKDDDLGIDEDDDDEGEGDE